MNSLLKRAGRFGASEGGAAATEYAVLIALIAIGVLMTMSTFGDTMTGLYLAISGAVSNIT